MDEGTNDFSRLDVSHISTQANLVYGISQLADAMSHVERTYCDHNDGRPENNAEHSFMLSLVAVVLAEEHYRQLDRALVAKYALIHDLVEVYVGDTASHNLDDDGWRRKEERERAGLTKLVTQYKDIAPRFTRDMIRYEEQKDDESRFVRMLDKLMTVVIQLPHGYSMKIGFTPKTHEAMVRERIKRFIKQYPDQKAMLELYDELAHYMRKVIWPFSSDDTIEA